MKYRVGDWVEVRSKEEILATLDRNGRLEEMPFMPEMLAYCGKRMRVQRRTHKACDTINSMTQRSLPNSVLLEGMRCSGAAHGGCEALCTVFWHVAWLKPTNGADSEPPTVGEGCTEEQLIQATTAQDASDGEVRYRCQATDFPLYGKSLRAREMSQYVEDYASGNTTLKEMVLTSSFFLFKAIAQPKHEADGGWYRGVYNWFQGLWGGVPYPRRIGRAKPGEKQRVETLNLQPGELVRVKSYEEILATLDTKSMNRGLFFDAEMVPYCGGVFRVRARVDKFINEHNGKMIRLKTPAVILDGIWCRGRYSAYRLFCPRIIYSWWREAWLERAPEASEPDVSCALGAREILKSRPGEALV